MVHCSTDQICYFNPRSLVGNDGLGADRSYPDQIFQSTFPRGERRVAEMRTASLGQSISIHVPSWGTTTATSTKTCIRPISIHVPSWGTTQETAHHQATTIYDFNPRSLVGNDEQCRDPEHVLQYISIHVPSWGTTANFHKYSLFFYAINIIFLLFIIPSLFSLVLFMLLF